MDNLEIFTESILTDKVRLAPYQLANDMRKVIMDILVEKNEGKCSKYGYIREQSIKILKVSAGQVRMVSLNGDVIFTVQYRAEVCNPTIGKTVKAVITNINKFGILAEVRILKAIKDDVSESTAIMEIIITKQGVGIVGSVNLEKLEVGQTINIEILGKKFELNDKKICAIGKVVESDMMKEGAPVLDENDVVDDENDVEDEVVAEVDAEDDEDQDEQGVEEEIDELEDPEDPEDLDEDEEGSLLSFEDDDDFDVDSEGVAESEVENDD